MIRFKHAMCCAMLAGTTVLVVPRANAQSDDDKKFLATAAQADRNEIALSEVAEKKATDPAVKAFAQKMVKEHTSMSASMKPFAEQWSVNAPAAVDSDHQKELDKLNGLSGKDFDKEYMDQMVSDHSKALDAFTSEAKTAKDAKFRAAVLKGKTQVAAHKNMAYDLKGKL
jgi:putative membrane protein